MGKRRCLPRPDNSASAMMLLCLGLFTLATKSQQHFCVAFHRLFAGLGFVSPKMERPGDLE